MIYKPRIVFIAGVVLLAAGNAFGQVKTVWDLSAAVKPGSTVKYSDLFKLVFTDFSVDTGSASNTIPIRHVSGDHKEMPLRGDFKVQYFETIELRDPQGPVIVISIDLTSQLVLDDLNATDSGWVGGVVAAFRISPTVKLLDAFDVKADQFTGLAEQQSVIPIGPRQSAFFVSNSHDNSDQSYDIISAFFLARDRFRPIFTGISGRRHKLSTTDLFLFSERRYNEKTGCELLSQETVHFFPIRQPGITYYKLGVRVRVAKTASGDECTRPRRHTIYYRGGWEWDSARRRFRPSPGGNLDQFVQH
jgi:hypothetical protein